MVVWPRTAAFSLLVRTNLVEAAKKLIVWIEKDDREQALMAGNKMLDRMCAGNVQGVDSSVLDNLARLSLYVDDTGLAEQLAERMASVFPRVIKHVTSMKQLGALLARFSVVHDRLVETVRVACAPVQRGCWRCSAVANGQCVDCLRHQVARVLNACALIQAVSQIPECSELLQRCLLVFGGDNSEKGKASEKNDLSENELSGDVEDDCRHHSSTPERISEFFG